MNKTTSALNLAEAYIAGMKWSEEADEALAAIREALAEPVTQEPVIDLSKIRHEDKCCYWDDEAFCDCGADSHEILKWYRKKNAAPVSAEPCKECDAKQAKIDRLMWEFCPQEMTPEQVANWEAHQQPWSDK